MVYDWPGWLGRWLSSNLCTLCDGIGQDGLCNACHHELPWNRHACRRCALPLPPGLAAGDLCPSCRRHPPAFDRVLAPLRYDGPVPALIHDLKYRARFANARLLGGLISRAADSAPLPQLLLPTPLHPRRLRSRGFNQAAELTRQLAGQLEIPWRATRLRRIVDTPSQTGLNRRERRRGLRGAFAWHGPREWDSVAIVDDVITTGATAEEMARTLKQAGFSRVEIWAAARTPSNRSVRAPSNLPV